MDPALATSAGKGTPAIIAAASNIVALLKVE
jgi:hypothetical protein